MFACWTVIWCSILTGHAFHICEFITLKVCLILLETITTLEWESSPQLHEATLRGVLVSLSGHAGSFCALDFMQEYFNRLLKAIVQRKGVDYGAPYLISDHMQPISFCTGQEGVWSRS